MSANYCSSEDALDFVAPELHYVLFVRLHAANYVVTSLRVLYDYRSLVSFDRYIRVVHKAPPVLLLLLLLSVLVLVVMRFDTALCVASSAHPHPDHCDRSACCFVLRTVTARLGTPVAGADTCAHLCLLLFFSRSRGRCALGGQHCRQGEADQQLAKGIY